MKLIKINLNQTVSKAQLDYLNEEKKRWYIFGSICTLFLSTFIWFFIINHKINYIIHERDNTINDILLKTEELKSQGKINLSKIDINNFYKIEQKRILWAEKLMALSEITPEDMAITKLEFKGKKLNISAVSNLSVGEKEFTVIEEFISLLEKNNIFSKHFSSVKFNNSRLDKSQGQEFLFFEVELILNTKKIKKK